VTRVNGHRSTDGIYCERCGHHVTKWESLGCIPSNVEVLVPLSGREVRVPLRTFGRRYGPPGYRDE
jgi:hypothetical protein